MSSLRTTYGLISNSAQRQRALLVNLTTNGIPTGDSNMAVNGSITPVDFTFDLPLGIELELVKVIIEISDSGNPGLDDYGNITGPLANGIEFFSLMDSSEVPFVTDIQSNREILLLGPFAQREDFLGGTSVVTYTIDLWGVTREGLKLNGNLGDKVGVRVRDNLTSLIAHSVTIGANFKIKSVA